MKSTLTGGLLVLLLIGAVLAIQVLRLLIHGLPYSEWVCLQKGREPLPSQRENRK